METFSRKIGFDSSIHEQELTSFSSTQQQKQSCNISFFSKNLSLNHRFFMTGKPKEIALHLIAAPSFPLPQNDPAIATYFISIVIRFAPANPKG